MTKKSHVGKLEKGQIVAATWRDSDNETGGKNVSAVLEVKKLYDDEFIGIFVKDRHLRRTEVTIPYSSVEVNFGKNPTLNTKVHGVNLSKLWCTATEPFEGVTLHWFYKPEDNHVEMLHEGAVELKKWMKANSLLPLFELPIAFEIYNTSGDILGCYKHSKKPRVKPSIVELHTAKLFTQDDEDVTPYYVLAHEIGHAIHRTALNRYPKHIAKWTELYVKTVLPRTVTKDALGAVSLKLEGVESLKEWSGKVESLEDDEATVAFKLLGLYFVKVRGIDRETIDQMLAAGAHEQLASMFPKPSTLIERVKSPLVTPYACTNVHELIAECFAFRACGKQLPRECEELMDRALQLAAKALPKAVSEFNDPDSSSEA